MADGVNRCIASNSISPFQSIVGGATVGAATGATIGAVAGAIGGPFDPLVAGAGGLMGAIGGGVTGYMAGDNYNASVFEKCNGISDSSTLAGQASAPDSDSAPIITPPGM